MNRWNDDDFDDDQGRAAPLRRRAKPSRVISAEETALWLEATRAIDPLERAKPRVSGDGDGLRPPVDPARKPGGGNAGLPPDKAQRPGTAGDGDARSPATDATGSGPPAVSPRTMQQALVPGFERRTARKVASGQIDIDARLDLHGLTQVAAQRRLRAFLKTAHANDHRLVLVITGKGRDNDNEPETLAEHMDNRTRGILRRSVPIWLDDPEMRATILAIAPASLQHGGTGALYVRLRRRRD